MTGSASAVTLTEDIRLHRLVRRRSFVNLLCKRRMTVCSDQNRFLQRESSLCKQPGQLHYGMS